MLSQREAFARLFEHLVAHDSHGYSQVSRLGDGGTEMVDLGEGVTVEIATGDRDCSSAVIGALASVGVDTRGATYTGNLLDICQTGQFVAHERANGGCKDGYSARRGDLYLNVEHHVAVCKAGANETGGDTLMQFSISERGTVDGAEGDQTGVESNTKAFYDYPWTHTVAWANDGKMLGGPDLKGSAGDMNILINVPAEGDVKAVTLWLSNDNLHDIENTEALRYLQHVYKVATGEDMPVITLHATKETPELQRLIQCIRGGIPGPELIPEVDFLGSRSEDRASGNDSSDGLNS